MGVGKHEQKRSHGHFHFILLSACVGGAPIPGGQAVAVTAGGGEETDHRSCGKGGGGRGYATWPKDIHMIRPGQRRTIFSRRLMRFSVKGCRICGQE
jgi:hypothetical protein